jgi:hypothetical protein
MERLIKYRFYARKENGIMVENGEKFEKITTITPAFDRRDPNPNKNYGIHGCELRMVLKGELGATQFLVFTNWQLPHVTEEFLNKNYTRKIELKCAFLPTPADVGHHSPKPFYEEQTKRDDCPYLDGNPCYYDGSGLRAEEWYDILVEYGSDKIWEMLEEEYYSRFCDNLEKGE